MTSDTPLLDALFLELERHANVQTPTEILMGNKLAAYESAGRELLTLLPLWSFRPASADELPYVSTLRKLKAIIDAPLQSFAKG